MKSYAEQAEEALAFIEKGLDQGQEPTPELWRAVSGVCFEANRLWHKIADLRAVSVLARSGLRERMDRDRRDA